VIIDNNPDAINIIKQNAKTLGLFQKTNILQGECLNIMKRFKPTEQFDLIFLDPPFKLKVIDELITYIIEHNLLSVGGYIVCEYPKEDIVRKNYETLEVHLCRRYSSSEVLILERVE
jgi:16S rRNA G966 N2-methylase RsmD